MSLDGGLQAPRAIRSSSSPISSLPAETLIPILLSLVEPIGIYQPQTWSTHVELTRVCRRWRNLAIGCPAFWSCIPLTNWEVPARLKEVLTRSKDYPLSVRLRRDISPPGYPPLPSTGAESQNNGPTLVNEERAWIELLKTQAYRIRHLHLRVGFEQMPSYHALITEDTPCLVSLSVVVSQMSSSDHLNSFPTLFDPHHLFDTRTMPSLQHLHIQPRLSTASWLLVSPSTSLILSNLITLKLDVLILRPGDDAYPPYLVMLDILRACTRVQTLGLWSCITDDAVAFSGSTESRAAGRVQLPHLISLTLRGNINTLTSVIRFLSYLSVPRKAGIDLPLLEPQRMGRFEPLQSQSDLIRDLFLYSGCGIREVQPGQSYTTRYYEVMDMRINGRAMVTIRLFNPCSCEASDGKHCTAHNNGPLSLGFIGIVDDFTPMILELLDLRDCLKELRVTHSRLRRQPVEKGGFMDFGSLSVEWRSFFARHPSLRRITLHSKEEDVCGILNALAARSKDYTWDLVEGSRLPISQGADVQVDLDNGSSMADQEVPLPSLQALELSDGVLERTSTGLGNYIALESMLASRARHGKGIPFIRLSTSLPVDSREDEMLAKIRQINRGGNVIWG